MFGDDAITAISSPCRNKVVNDLNVPDEGVELKDGDLISLSQVIGYLKY
jgi:uncharacterized protein YciW